MPKLWKMLKRLTLALFLLLLVLAGGGYYLYQTWLEPRLEEPYSTATLPILFEVEPGQPASVILENLQRRGLLRDARVTRHYLVWVMKDPPLRAGEYQITAPMTPRALLDKLIRGDVYVRPLKLIEGLTAFEMVDEMVKQGFGDKETFLREIAKVDRIADLDPAAQNLEGYLYPDTYLFASKTSEAKVIDTLVAGFRKHLKEEVAPVLGPGSMPLRQLVTLASIVEKETQKEEERAVVASVYRNRLDRDIGLYADPTIIYAKKLAGTWDGNLRRPDLQLDSPYNTYVVPGLPPGPICSPTVRSLLAAAQPADTGYLYFVSRNDGTHVFSETLAEHNRNVDLWQRQYWQRRWATERARAAGPGRWFGRWPPLTLGRPNGDDLAVQLQILKKFAGAPPGWARAERSGPIVRSARPKRATFDE